MRDEWSGRRCWASWCSPGWPGAGRTTTWARGASPRWTSTSWRTRPAASRTARRRHRSSTNLLRSRDTGFGVIVRFLDGDVDLRRPQTVTHPELADGDTWDWEVGLDVDDTLADLRCNVIQVVIRGRRRRLSTPGRHSRGKSARALLQRQVGGYCPSSTRVERPGSDGREVVQEGPGPRHQVGGDGVARLVVDGVPVAATS